MADTTEKIKTANSVVRTGIVVTLLSAIGYGGCLGYNQYVVPANQAKITLAKLEEIQGQYAALQANFAEQAKEVARLETSLKLLKMDRRLANVNIVKKGKDDEGNPFIDVEFYEVSGNGTQIGETRPFRLQGDQMYVSTWVVQFDDHYVEKGDPLRSASLCVFKSIWGNIDGPNGGHSLDRGDDDKSDLVPEAYKEGAEVNEFEQKIWSDFWSVSNNPEKQMELGIRASSGVAPFIQVEQGQVYQFEVRSSGSVSMKPLNTLNNDETPQPTAPIKSND
jgi:hypothetical protein